jgi:lysophospholipase L1-like esterase
MGRARRALRVAQAAAYGGGVGVAGLGTIGALGYGLLKAEAALARMAIGTRFERPPNDAGWYAAARVDRTLEPLRMVVLGDSSAAGLGAATRGETIGARLARGVSEAAGRRVHLSNVAVSGAKSIDLDLQVANVLDLPHPVDIAVISIGANDVTHRIDTAVAVRHLREAVAALRETGAEVVVATCPDLGTVQPVPQPLRLLARRLGRDLAAAQTIAVVSAGGRTVSVGHLLGAEFAARPGELFSEDRFHPSGRGYARVAAVLLPCVLEALGLPSPTRCGAHLADLVPVRVERAARDAARRPGTAVEPGSTTSARPTDRLVRVWRERRRAVPSGPSQRQPTRHTIKGPDRAEAAGDPGGVPCPRQSSSPPPAPPSDGPSRAR